MSKFCENCGTELKPGAKFCPECGSPVPAQVSEDSAKPVNKTEQFSAARANEKAQPETKAKKSSKDKKSNKKGDSKKALSIFLVIVMIAELFVIAFKYPGIFAKRGGGSIESAAFDAGTLTAETADGVSVKLDEYTFEEGMQLTSRQLEPVYAENGDYVIDAYDINIGDMHELDSFVTVRIPFDSSFCDSGENPADCVGAVYYNEGTGEWEDCLYTVDEAAGELVITTDHFSTYGAFKVKNSGKRNAYLVDNALFIPELLDENKAIAVMSEYVDSAGQQTAAAKLMGNEAIMASLAITDATANTADAVGNVFAAATYLDGIDLAMKGDWSSLQIFDKYSSSWIKSNPPDTKLFYDNGFAEKTSNVLSKVGLAISAVKLTYAFGQAAAGNASYADKLNLYKDTLNLAISLSGSATLSALMLPVFIADKFINSMFEEAFAIKHGQLEEEYEYFNRKYEGSTNPEIRPGRDTKAWRKVIIDLINENPDADADKLIAEEIDTFANDFWNLSAMELDWFASSLPKDVKRIPDTTASEREDITNTYKAQLYRELEPVMQSVRQYFENKQLQQVIKDVAEAKRLYNKSISITVTEALPEGEKSDYAGCTVRFMPLSTLADENSWTFKLDENGSLKASCTYLGYLQAGCPYAVCVYENGADPNTAEPLVTVKTGLKNGTLSTVLESLKQEETTTEKPHNTLLPFEADVPITDSYLAYKTNTNIYEGKKAHILIKENGDYTVTIPALSGAKPVYNAGGATYSYKSLSVDEITFKGHFPELLYGEAGSGMYSAEDVTVSLASGKIGYSGSLITENRLSGEPTVSEQSVSASLTPFKGSTDIPSECRFFHRQSDGYTSIILEFKCDCSGSAGKKQLTDSVRISFEIDNKS